MTRLAICGALLLALLSTPALAQKVTLSEMISHDDLDHVSLRKDLTHDFSQKPEKVRVTLKCKLKRGEFSWSVENAEGKKLWQDSVQGKGKVEHVELFPGQEGEWRIVIDTKKAKGSYHLKMEAVY